MVDKFPRLEARFDPAENVSRGRLRFRPTGGVHWCSVPMKKEAEAFLGVLPKPTAKLKSLDYYVEVTATDFATGRTAEYAPEVVSGLGACQGDKITAGSLGSATIILEVPAGAPAVPAGFSSAGIVAAAATAAAAAAATGVAAGGGIGATTVVLGGLLVAGGAAAAVAASANAGEPARPPDPTTLDNDRDGFTPQQGDCDDANPALTPNSTGFEAVATFGGQGTLVCAVSNISETTVTIRNLSCSPLSATLQVVTEVGAGPCCGTPNTVATITLPDFLVGAGASVTRVVLPGGLLGFCCAFQRCCTLACSKAQTLTVATSAGVRLFTNSFGLAGACPSCAAPTAAGDGFPERVP